MRDDTPLLWRDEQTIQAGDDGRRVVIGQIDQGAISWALSLRGDRTLEQALDGAEQSGVRRSTALRLLRALRPTGALDDASVVPESLREATPELRARLAPGMAAARIVHGSADVAAACVDRRLAACIAIHGDGDVAEAVAAALGQAGVGSIVREQRLSSSSRRARRASRQRTCHILCDAPHADAAAEADDLALDVPHLAVCVRGARATIGPFVLPGLTSCLRCADLHRADQDPAWPRVAVQLQHRRPAIPPIDPALASTAAGLTALQVLAWIDRGDHEGAARWPRGWPEEAPPTVGGRMVIALPGGDVTRIPAPPHPLCGCRWA